MIWDHCVRQRVRCSLPFQNGRVTQRPSVDSIWPKSFDPAQNHFGPIKGGLLFQISLLFRPEIESFRPLCQSACAMQLAVLKWPCDTNTKASLGKCPHKKGGWCQKQKSEQGIANWLWGAKRSSSVLHSSSTQKFRPFNFNPESKA